MSIVLEIKIIAKKDKEEEEELQRQNGGKSRDPEAWLGVSFRH